MWNKDFCYIYFPYKNGTLAIQEDTKWTGNLSLNGWLKEPGTGVIIQCGHIPHNVWFVTFSVSFPSTVASISSECINQDTKLRPHASAIYDFSLIGFDLTWGALVGSSPYAGKYTRWLAIGW
ncbi:MAG: hypothetical protein ACL7BU_12095 [Candidatus Phlomobacter fragariae]